VSKHSEVNSRKLPDKRQTVRRENQGWYADKPPELLDDRGISDRYAGACYVPVTRALPFPFEVPANHIWNELPSNGIHLALETARTWRAAERAEEWKLQR
jgi:hypothetical protein